jgi:hypothetical protein
MVQEFCCPDSESRNNMQTLSNTRNDVNSLACESFVKPSYRLARVSFAFTPMPYNFREVLTPSEERMHGALISLAQRGIVEPCIRFLASVIRRSERTVQRLLRSLERKRVIAIIERRISSFRNAPNLYKLLGLVFHGGVGDKSVTEKNRKFLKTTTPAPERGAGNQPGPSIPALQHQLRQRQDEIDHWRKRFEYDENGNLWAKFKEWRSNGVEQRDRMRSEALVGVYKKPVLTEEQQREEKRLWDILNEEIREFEARIKR